MVKRNAAHAEIIRKYEIRYFNPLSSGSDFVALAENPLILPQLLDEMVVYLAFQRDKRISELLETFLEDYDYRPSRNEIKRLLKQVEHYNPGVFQST